MHHTLQLCMLGAAMGLLLLTPVTHGAGQGAEADFYVAPDGQDSFDGRLPTPDGACSGRGQEDHQDGCALNRSHG